MTERERLAEIYYNIEIEYLDYLTKIAERAIDGDIEDKIQHRQDFYVDKLLANGVIVPPCKEGDTVYAVDKRSGLWWRGKTIAFYYVNPNDMRFAVAFEDGEVSIYDVDCVFPTKEEAEAAMKARDEG